MGAPIGNKYAEGYGRPPKPIDWQLFEDLCQLQCTQSEICSILHVCSETLYDRVLLNYGEVYSEVFKTYSEGGKSCIRRYQFNMAKTNTAMAIWLGKQWLGQRDHEEKSTIPINAEDVALKNYLIKKTFEQEEKILELEKKLNVHKSQANPIDQ